MHISDGSVEQIQVVIPSSVCDEDCCFNSAVEISGKVVVSPKPNQPVEIQGETVKVVGKLDLQSFPFGPRKYYAPEYVRQQIHLRPKTNIYSAILRLSSLITNALQTTLIQDNFVSVFTPILTSNDCEGAGEVFLTRPASDEMCREMGGNRKLEESYFNKKVYLTVSGQLHLEAIAGGISKVFTLGPTFRSENSRSRRHLAEFRMLEAEIAFCNDLQPILSTIESLVKHSAKVILEHGALDLITVGKYYNENLEESLNEVLKSPFTTISYREAMELLLNNRDSFKTPPRDEADIGSEHELFLVKHMGGPTFLVDWPAKIKPFYMRTNNDDNSLVSCVDLLVPGVGELCGGSLRENRYDILKSRLESLNLEESLSWYLDLRKYGGSPTGGFGMGVERLISYLLKIPNVKDIVPFPRTPHNCPM
ncbi:hypothetical protein DAPPUDRAFT_307813 [Daphnia pulex]|uniref:asparagine--tRNA ligase n=1 Tax=Daphnia pulex TaxID=6669 RepID=E9G1G5_DAPPU|nr:hypothetical protein DAPPUDRAFT_307813 [Daphnia pulex]|eukprot:EFX86821.1 hypothetical protein DAPPUDRAFT_307813 [Daphnia pulex]